MSVTKRSYNQPAKYVRFAAVEACAAAGFEGGPAADVGGGMEITGERSILFGFFLGQGGERVKVDIREAGPLTNVAIESRKRSVGFGCQRHHNVRIASYLDSYLQENEVIRGLHLGRKVRVKDEHGVPTVACDVDLCGLLRVRIISCD